MAETEPPVSPIHQLEDVLSLLERCGLPAADISPLDPPSFFGIRCGNELVAAVGLESFESAGLLRSLAVLPAHRGRGSAHRLVAFCERVAAARGVEHLYLLTTTAAAFFERLGYTPAPRSAAPTAIALTPQFSDLCPASAAFFTKPLAKVC